MALANSVSLATSNLLERERNDHHLASNQKNVLGPAGAGPDLMHEVGELSTMAAELCRYARSHLLQEGVELNERTQFKEAGVDSFSLVELLLFAERRFGVKVPGAELTPANIASPFSLTQCIARLGGRMPPPA